MKRREKGLALISFALSLLILVPMIGLAVDSAMLYIIKERLHSAALLSLRSAQRSQHPEEAVNRFFTANFPEGFFGVRERTIAYKPGQLHATVEAPTYFMRVLKVPTVRVEATVALPPPAVQP